MPNPPESIILPKNGQTSERGGREHTPAVSWLTVFLGGGLLLGNALELGGVTPSAKEWTAWMLAAMVLVHAVAVGWGVQNGSGFRIPKWPLMALPLLGGLAIAWFCDGQTPWLSRDTFFLAIEAWLLCWVVAATPGSRTYSWAWILMVGLTGLVPLIAAIGWQLLGKDGWLPMGRTLPAIWDGRFSGTLPTPAAFGGLMILSGPPLLVMACSVRLPVLWRTLCGVLGILLLLGALGSYSLGAWLGVAFVLASLAMVVGCSRPIRILGYGIGALCVVGLTLNAVFDSSEIPLANVLNARLQAGEPGFTDTLLSLERSWQANPLLGIQGAPYATLMPGWRYGFNDWLELAAVWGLAGLILAGLVYGIALVVGWSSWAKLPFAVSRATPPSFIAPEDSSEQAAAVFTPETKVLLGAALMSLSAFGVAMLASRVCNLPVMLFALAIIAGILARNVPQRGGAMRLEPAMRRAASVGAAVLVGFALIGLIAPVARAQNLLRRAELDFAYGLADKGPPDTKADILAAAESGLYKAIGTDSSNAPGWAQIAWINLERSRLDPLQFNRYSDMAEDAARRAHEIAPKAPEPLVALAAACLRNNRVAEAEAHIRTALAMAPADPQVRYYAIAIFAVDPKTRALAQRMLDSAREEARVQMQHGEAFSQKQLKALQAAFDTCANSPVPLDERRERALPRYFPRASLWPPLEGCSAAAPEAAPPARREGV